MKCKLISYPSLESENDNSLLFINLCIYLTNINNLGSTSFMHYAGHWNIFSSVQSNMYLVSVTVLQFSSVAPSCETLCDPMDCRMPGLLVHYQFSEFTQIHVHWISDANQPSHPLSCPSPPSLNFSQHQGLFKWVSFSHQAAKVLELQLQHQSFQRLFRTDFL